MKKGLTNILFANILYLLIGVASNFILPKFLSIESYAQIKSYSLYIVYAGLFHLGYADGMYLLFGGKSIGSIDGKELADNYVNFFFLCGSATALLLLASLWSGSRMLAAFAVGLTAFNAMDYTKHLYLATGEFKLYGAALNLEKILIFLIDMTLIFVVRTDAWELFVWTRVLVWLLISAFLLIRQERRRPVIGKGRIRLSVLRENIATGIYLLGGNLSSTLFTGIDRWFVKLLLPDVDFALYSFAVSMENLINAFISPISLSMYNYFCRERDLEKIRRIKGYVLIWGFVIIAAAFPGKFILEHYLTQYAQAAEVMFFLFGAQAFYAVIKGIYVNIYKAEKKQSKYLRQVVAMTVTAVALNALFFALRRTMGSIACATLVTAVLWLCVCERDNAALRFSGREILAAAIMLATFLLCGRRLPAAWGLLAYLLVGLVTARLLMRESFMGILRLALAQLGKLGRRAK